LFRFEAIGVEWDGKFKPIEELAYKGKPKDIPLYDPDECDEPTVVKRGG